ncbi:MAG: hypothetical protein K0R15_1972 [Clostridiales bacterium]|jgi:hypothetical protein|nr:hypothetical protein [Clostridiales bacterium]
MDENIERLLEIGVGMLLCMIAISLIFTYQDLIEASYNLLIRRNGG